MPGQQVGDEARAETVLVRTLGRLQTYAGEGVDVEPVHTEPTQRVTHLTYAVRER